MKVALVCPYDLSLPGGVQQQVLELGARLTASGHQAWAVGPGAEPLSSAYSWVSVGGAVGLRGNASVVPVALGRGVVGRVREAITEADVVHVHEPLMPLASLAAFLTDKPTVGTFHAAAPNWVSVVYRAASPLLRRRFRRAEITAVSPVAAEAIPASWGVPELIPNGLEVDSYRRSSQGTDRQVVFLGRDEPRKGLDVLVEAWDEVARQVPQAQLVVLGASRRPRPGIRFEGRVTEARKREVLASSAVYVAPHLGGESFGIVLAEAMAAECALVASDLPAFRMVAHDAARFVPPGSPSDLAAAIVGILGSAGLRDALVERGNQAVRRFDWQQVIDRYLNAYRSAIDAA